MPSLELAADEAALLDEVLTSWLSELRMEIADTDAKDYRATLQAKERTIELVLRRVKAATPA